MKNLFYLFTAVCLLHVLCFNAYPGGEDPVYWEKLEKMNMVGYVKVYDDPEKTLEPGKAKRYIIDMTFFREMLEKAEVTELVRLELYSKYKGRKIAGLGKYEPKIETVEGEREIKFDSIPVEKKIYVALEDFIRKRSHNDVMDDMRFLLPNPAYLVIKNAKKKIKAWVQIKFLYTSR